MDELRRSLESESQAKEDKTIEIAEVVGELASVQKQIENLKRQQGIELARISGQYKQELQKEHDRARKEKDEFDKTIKEFLSKKDISLNNKRIKYS